MEADHAQQQDPEGAAGEHAEDAREGPRDHCRVSPDSVDEALTDELEQRAWELIEHVDELGGAVAAIEQGFVQDEIEQAAFEHQRQVERGERVIVGVNRFAEDEREPIELHRIDAEAERRQLDRTARVRSERNADEAARALEEVRRTARGTDNLLPAMREALRAHCTIGEICNVLRDEFGVYDARRA